MKLTSPEIVELIRSGALQQTDVFLRLGKLPRFAEYAAFAKALQTRALVLLPGTVHSCGAPAQVLRSAAAPAQAPESDLYFADVRMLMEDGAEELLIQSGIRELVLPFYECADISEYGYKMAYGSISNLRAALPFPLHITALSNGDHLQPPVFETLGTTDYILVGEEKPPELSAVHMRDERAALYFTADLCRKYPLKRTVVQCTTRTKAEALAAVLRRGGTACEVFHGGRTAEENDAALAAFTAGKVNILVGTKSLLPSYPFFTADKVFYYGLPYSVSHTARVSALSDSGKTVCVYCDADIAANRRLTEEFAAALQFRDEAFFTARERQLTELMNLFAETGHS